MSGGSYNYLYRLEPEELLIKAEWAGSDLQSMADALAELGYATDAAAETQHLIQECRVFLNRVRVKQERLAPVWKAMEWWHSYDSTEETVKEALMKYRGETS